jgi:hypothetical protein
LAHVIVTHRTHHFLAPLSPHPPPQEEAEDAGSLVFKLELPFALKRVLVDDWEFVTQK